MVEQGKAKRQEVHLVNRKLLEISGVRKVESFDSDHFLLDTECGLLEVKGQNLHIKNLSLEQGLVAIEGVVRLVAYVEAGGQEKGKGLLGKLFK
ncbi:sporulation protein YabP [Paenibacillus sp. y28]|uniref:sporulation protein YabP n=1 Tax=Paenibacillus sp. y28 TaxID=3129110 RepID=UPI0030163EC4